MNPHTTSRNRRGRRGQYARAPRRGQPGHARRHASPAIGLLAPTPCDATPVPFATFGLDPRLAEGIRDLGYAGTRPVQSAVIPLALAGRDVIAGAETGTGKTAAFAVPVVQQLLSEKAARPHGPAASEPGAAPLRPKSRVLVLAPTRELAVQIEDEIHGLSYHTPLASAAVYGGVEMGPQERALAAGVDIIVATPGRLLDHMRQQNADLSAIEILVLDEADRMMDMGFWPDVRRIIAAVPGARQTLLFSATMPDEVVRQALEIVRDAAFVQIGQRSAPPKSITHRSAPVASSAKLDWIIEHVRRSHGPVLVFMRTKIGAERLARKLAAANIRTAALHADRTQEQRRAAVEGFRGGRFAVLVATDIAARGLDIDGIRSVINYEVPDSADIYVHRVGRTGRADEVGEAITLVSPEELGALALLEKSVGVRLE